MRVAIQPGFSGIQNNGSLWRRQPSAARLTPDTVQFGQGGTYRGTKHLGIFAAMVVGILLSQALPNMFRKNEPPPASQTKHGFVLHRLEEISKTIQDAIAVNYPTQGIKPANRLDAFVLAEMKRLEKQLPNSLITLDGQFKTPDRKADEFVVRIRPKKTPETSAFTLLRFRLEGDGVKHIYAGTPDEPKAGTPIVTIMRDVFWPGQQPVIDPQQRSEDPEESIDTLTWRINLETGKTIGRPASG